MNFTNRTGTNLNRKKLTIVSQTANEIIADVTRADNGTGGTELNAEFFTQLCNDLFPIGSIVMSTINVSPAGRIGGTWVAWGKGRVPAGVDTNKTNYNTVEKTGGADTHTLTTAQIPSHGGHVTYNQSNYIIAAEVISGNVGGDSGRPWQSNFCSNELGISTSSIGGTSSHNNLQAYITCYMFKRVS